MKRYSCLVLFLILLSIENFVFSQKPFMKFGNIPKEDLTMTKYLKDSTAGAVVLGDFGTTKFNYSQQDGFTLEFMRHVRIKILDKRELNQADFSIVLYNGIGGDKEDYSSLKAITYNLENGKEVKTKLERNGIFEEIADKNHKLVKFNLPNVKEGSVLDVTYTITSPFLFNLNNWRFQSSIPTVRSEYHVNIPEYYYYKNWITGYIPIIKTEESNTETYMFKRESEMTKIGPQNGGVDKFEIPFNHWTYVAENIPAFIPEPYITTINDYLGYVEFELVSKNFPGTVVKYFTSTWENINEELMNDEDFGKQLNRSGHFKDIVTKINASANDPQSKMILAYESIKNKLVWDRRYNCKPNSGIVKPFNAGGGSSAEINLNLIALLRELGLEANPVLVSTRSNGMLKPGQVILSQFNHVIASAQINDKLFLLDATDPYCPYFMLPPNSLNGKGLMVSKTGYKWVDLYSQLVSKKTLFGQFSINNNLEFEGKISNSCENYSALEIRKEIKAKTSLDEYQKDLEKKFDVSEINELQIDNIDSLYKPIILSMNIKMNDKSTAGNGMFYFNPVLIERINENYFKKDTREYPVDFNYPFLTKYIFLITIPDGYEVVELPKPTKIALPDNGGKFSYVIMNEGKNINLTCELSINQTLFPAPNYPELKKFYEIVVAKMAEQVVLKKVI
jgi:hypothetical protein